jgi:nucleotide-binding universal stress UspA family protein
MFDKILVAVDGSDPSLHALEVAVTMAKQNDAELKIVTVVPPVPPMVEGDMPHYTPDFSKDLRESYTRMLNNHVKNLKEKHANLKAEGIVTEGVPARKIIEESRKLEADMIILGNRGTSGIFTWMLGSVSRQVTDACTVPVLVVKDEKFCKA